MSATAASASSVRLRFAILCLTLANSSFALHLPSRSDAAWTRRQVAVAAAGSSLLTSQALLPLQASAAEKSEGGVSWSIDLPPDFNVQERLASITRIKIATMLKADSEASGATVKLLLLPLGQQAGGSLNADEQFAVATHFFDAQSKTDGPDTVAKTMTTSASRSPGIASLARVGKASGYEAADGARYVKYEYTSSRCAGELYEGECLGSLSNKRTLAMVSMSSLSQYRTNTERAKMKELGQERNVQVLWLLTMTAPEKAWSGSEATFERIAASFKVPFKPY